MELLADIFWFLTFFVCISFIILGIDDIIFDVVYWTTDIYLKFKGRVHLILKGDKLKDISTIPEKKIAMMVPCWNEKSVIGEMLRYNSKNLDYQNYEIFVGAYPNDKDTITILNGVAKEIPNIHPVINSNDGPTTKGDNLNSILKRIREYEAKEKVIFDIYVINDAEDVIHRKCFKMFNLYSEDYEMIQLPVLPLEDKPWYNLNYWTYCDEFAENHNKDLVVRNRINGMVPSAGTGMALSKECVQKLSHNFTKPLFDEAMFTEDYDLSYRIHLHGLNSIFLKQWLDIKDEEGKVIKKELVCIKEYFPDTYSAAVNQKARWIFGIVFQELNKYQWHGRKMTKWNLFHDRKVILTHAVNLTGYVILVYILIEIFLPQVGLIQYIHEYSLLEYLLVITFLIMAQRLFERCIAVSTHYGRWQGFLSIFRFVYGNIINFHAFVKALMISRHHFTHRQSITWNKTSHEFPKAEGEDHEQQK